MAETKTPTQPSKFPKISFPEKGNRTRLYLLLALLLVVCLAAVAVQIFLGPGATPEPTATGFREPPDEVAEILPQLKRLETEQSPDDRQDFSAVWSPFSSPMEVQGIITGGRGGDLAIIRANSASYIVSVGETVAGVWEVQEINRNSVRLTRENEEIVIELTSSD